MMRSSMTKRVMIEETLASQGEWEPDVKSFMKRTLEMLS